MLSVDAPKQVEQYLERLRKALGRMPAAEREELVEEIRSHILERLEAQSPITEQALFEILAAVGDPGGLAAQYKTEAMLRRAATTRSPWVLLRTTLRWATTGVAGFVAFSVTLFGYGCATVAYLCALLKPVFPARIGLWLDPQSTLTLGYRATRLAAETYGISVRPPAFFVLGTLGPTDGPARELLGPWLFPVTLLLGVFCVFVTTVFVRWYIRRFGPRRFRRATPALACR